LRTDRYLKEYSIEREIWSIDRRRTDERARKTTTWRRFGTHFRVVIKEKSDKKE